MKTTIQKLLILIVILSFVSCEQDNFTPAKYSKNRFEEGAIHLYARGGEINDMAKVNHFIDNMEYAFA
ncbi:MAG TPA: hypothetical protein P5145_05375, partial [Tenuifilaceae bacterium]|nr:hypothetical protein [Tenuifilaceae bacterium]